MLADKIINILNRDGNFSYNELQKLGYNQDDNAWKQYEHKDFKDILIHYLCDIEIRETARKSTLKPSTKKKIKAVEKFLDQNKKNHNTKARPVFHYFKVEGNRIVYTNTHVLGVIERDDVEGIDERYNLSNLEGGVFPEWQRVVPDITVGNCEIATVEYSDVLATHKANRANKRTDYDIHVVTFDDGTRGGYNASYLLHAMTVLGNDKIKLSRNYSDEEQNLQAALATADNTESFFCNYADKNGERILIFTAGRD